MQVRNQKNTKSIPSRSFVVMESPKARDAKNFSKYLNNKPKKVMISLGRNEAKSAKQVKPNKTRDGRVSRSRGGAIN